MADAESPESIAPPPPEPHQAPAAEIGKESAAPPPPPQAAAEGSASRSLAAMMEKEESAEEEKPEKSRGEEVVVVETGKENTPTPILEEQQKKVPVALVSFKEESNKVDDLSDFERKAWFELKQLVQEALNTNQFRAAPNGGEVPAAASESKPKETQVKESETDAEKAVVEEQEQEQQQRQEEAVVSIWGIPLLKDDRSDVILLKFLRARDFKVKDAFAMIRSTVQWRERFKIDEIVNEDLGDDWEKVVFMHGQDRDGHPVCYNVYGEFQNQELYQKAFSDAEKRMRFLRWRIQFLERSIEKLDFSPGGVSTVFQVNDLKNSPGPGKRELRLATRLALHLLQDNYPEFVAKQVFINVPWWHLAFYTMISPFMTQRTKSKFVFASPAKTAETLFKYISPEQVPIQYGGLSVDSCDCNPEFSVDDPATEITLKPGTKQTVEIIIYEQCHIVWELRVVGWEVTYGAEFSPDAKGAYTIIIHKPTKMSPTDEPVVSNSFKVSDLGKIFLTVDNPTSKKKKLLYRFKVKPLLD